MTNEIPLPEWVSLGEAAQILGVHPATVRNWADRGELPSRRTPGGHRRFRRSDLKRWAETRQSPPPAEVQMLIQSALGQMHRRISDGEMDRLTWHAHLDEKTRELMRQKGRQILDVLQHYLTHPPDDPALGERVQRLGSDYAAFLIEQGLTLSQAMEGFLLFSDFLHEAALNIIELVTARSPGDWLAMLRQVRVFTNQFLLSLSQVYERSGR